MNLRIQTFGLIVIILLSTAELLGSETTPASVDPHLVIGHEKCAKCHQAEINVWQQTPHHKTFDALHRKPEANAIAKRLGLTSIKRNDVCIQCHYTQQQHGDRVKPIGGISCESCHGAAKEWLEVHNDYGGPQATKYQETPEHKRKRRELSVAKGMRNPVNLYLVARSCLACHTTPNEELVNIGGHPAGSENFELVAWSQGMVRHNFVRTEGRQNDVSAPDRLRVMFVVGVMTDLEFSLRATAMAKDKAKFGIVSAQRADRMRNELARVQQMVNDPHVQRALDAAFSAKLKLNNEGELLAVADQVSQAAYDFAEQADGAALSAIDSLLPHPAKYR
jgi:hypothetical protein